MGIFNKNKIDYQRLPQHIAFIMDGNGRWATKRGLARTVGHKNGVVPLEKIVKHSKKMGIKILSFYAFSTENWKRPQDEIDYIFKLIEDYLKDNKEEFAKNDIKINIVGDMDRLPASLQEHIIETQQMTKECSGMLVNVCLNYGSRAEIIMAINKIIKDGIKEVDEEIFRQYLQTSGIADPDLIVRTSGEYRLSNFMLYQGAYAELYFPKTYWPDFDEKQLEKAIIEYQKRNRRFGKV